jgi:hypothetical protein
LRDPTAFISLSSSVSRFHSLPSSDPTLTFFCFLSDIHFLLLLIEFSSILKKRITA